MKILEGRTLAEEIKARMEQEVFYSGVKHCLACVVVDGNSASDTYVASKKKACNHCKINSKIVRLPSDCTQEKLEQEIEKLNRNRHVNAILLQLPLPKHLNADKAINKISPEKDVDCLTYHNLGKLFAGASDYAPCTATGILKILEHYKIEIAGKNVVVIGRSLLVGRSVASLLMNHDATITVCHKKTKNLETLTKKADILIVAAGQPGLINASHVKKGVVIIDVGINHVDGKICGDVNHEEVKKFCSAITPVPGGVGPLTVACLMENTHRLAMEQHAKKTEKKAKTGGKL